MKMECRFAHSSGITDVTFSPDGENIITAGSDGVVRVWRGFDDDDRTSFSASDSCCGVVFNVDHVIVGTKSNTVEAYEFPTGKFLENRLKLTGAANHVDVSQDGKFLVVGSANMTLQVIPMDKSTPPVNVDAHSAPVLSVAVDPLQEFIASSGCDGQVCIWSFENPKLLVKKWMQVFPSSNNITTRPTLCRMAWHPLSGKQLAVPEKGKIVLYRRESWEEAKSLMSSKLTKFFSVVNFSNCGSYVGAGGSDGTVAVWDALTYTLKAHIKEMNHITGIAFAPITNQLLCTDSNGRLLCIKEYSEAEGDDEAESQGQVDGPKDLTYGPVSPDDEDNDDARSVLSVECSTVSTAAPQLSATPLNPFTIPQKPFQPASTPEHLNHRFMVWNNVGIIRTIRSYSTEDEEFNEDAIDIEFHDATFHHAIHLRNQLDYHLGNMSTEVVALGCAKTADNNSKLMSINFATWDSSKEWTADFPDGEEVTGIALGTGWVAAATTKNRLRLFSASGIQKFTYNLAGTIIALTGYENMMFITYHNGVGINGNQNIFYAVLKLTSNCSRLTPLIIDTALPLSHGSTLSWVGFSDEGTPVFSDSDQTLQILNGRLWSTFCNMKDHLSGASDHFWVVGVSETSLHVRAVKCKGANYPPTFPRPTIMMLKAKIPLCEMDTEKSQLEDVMLQHMLLSSTTKRIERKGLDVKKSRHETEGNIKDILYKLFTLSCTHNRDLRASEYVAMMPTVNAMQLAMKDSITLQRVALTDRLQVIGRRKFNNEDEGNDEEFDDFESTKIITHTEHRHFASDGEPGPDGITSETPSLSKSTPDVIVVQDNSLMKTKDEEIQSIINSNFRNPMPLANSEDSMNMSVGITADKSDNQTSVSNGKGHEIGSPFKVTTAKKRKIQEVVVNGDAHSKAVTGGRKKKNVLEEKSPFGPPHPRRQAKASAMVTKGTCGFLTSAQAELFEETVIAIKKVVNIKTDGLPFECKNFDPQIEELEKVHKKMKSLAEKIQSFKSHCVDEKVKKHFLERVYRPRGLYQRVVLKFTSDCRQIFEEIDAYPKEFRTRKNKFLRFDVNEALIRLLRNIQSTVSTLAWHLQSLPPTPQTSSEVPAPTVSLLSKDCFVKMTRLETQNEVLKTPKHIPTEKLETEDEVLEISEPTPGKIFTCKHENCGRTYNNKSSYNSHRRTHRDRNFKCDNCHKTFIMSTDLKRHRQAVRSCKEGEKQELPHPRKISEESNSGFRPLTVEMTSLADFLRALDTLHHKLKHVECDRNGESDDESDDKSLNGVPLPVFRKGKGERVGSSTLASLSSTTHLTQSQTKR